MGEKEISEKKNPSKMNKTFKMGILPPLDCASVLAIWLEGGITMRFGSPVILRKKYPISLDGDLNYTVKF